MRITARSQRRVKSLEITGKQAGVIRDRKKSHAAAYSLVAYHTGWLKQHHPAAFAAATMSSEMANTDKVQFFWKDAIDKAAVANALRWDYIKKVLANPDKDRNAKQTHSKTPARRGSPDRSGRGSAFRYPQVDKTSDASMEKRKKDGYF